MLPSVPRISSNAEIAACGPETSAAIATPFEAPSPHARRLPAPRLARQLQFNCKSRARQNDRRAGRNSWIAHGLGSGDARRTKRRARGSAVRRDRAARRLLAGKPRPVGGFFTRVLPSPEAAETLVRAQRENRMQRREFMALLCGAAIAWPRAVGAQSRVYRIGLLSSAAAIPENNPQTTALVGGLAEHG